MQSLISFTYYNYIIQFLHNMTTMNKDLSQQLIDQKQISSQPVTEPVTYNEFQYKQFQNAPSVSFSGLVLIIICPLLIVAHIRACNMAQIPLIQFCFVTTLLAFLINYTAIIRKYELMPFLPEPLYDSKLKRMCVLAVGGMIISMIWGWNGSGGILFAILWESLRGNRFQYYGYLLLIVVAGSLIMEQNFYWKKLLEFIPGVFFGMINAQLFTLRDSSFYAVAHQFLLLTAIVIPILFPAFHIIVPCIWQWGVMIIGGVTVLFTTVCTIKLMQSERVSVVMGVMSGIIMVGSAIYDSSWDYVGAIVILVGVGLLIKKQYIDIAN